MIFPNVYRIYPHWLYIYIVRIIANMRINGTIGKCTISTEVSKVICVNVFYAHTEPQLSVCLKKNY